MESAKEICNSLLAAGYWADFIDPSSGTAVSNSAANNFSHLTGQAVPPDLYFDNKMGCTSTIVEF